ncbi:MAG TPA: hypothetical protein VIL85_05045 [Thermomicrobiales bacterium]|jgi:hypothetical protein
MGIPTSPQGIPAITPRLVPDNVLEPAFSKQDVVDYVLAHPVSGTGRIQTDSPITVESIEFLPAREVHARLNTTSGRPDDAPLCLVTIRGSFSLHGMRGMAPLHGTTVVQVYDARTGFFLLQGADAK